MSSNGMPDHDPGLEKQWHDEDAAEDERARRARQQHDDETCICGCEKIEHAQPMLGGRDFYPAEPHDPCGACTECHDGFTSISDAAERQGMQNP